MIAEPLTPDTPRLAEFVVRADGSVRGDDGSGGALAAALPYVGRLARRVGELVDGGDLRRIETAGGVRLSVGITWTPTGEGTYRAVVTEEASRAVPNFMVVGGADTAATVDHCVRRVASADDIAWSTLMGPDSRIVSVAGERATEVEHLPEIGTRVLGLLRELAAHQVSYVRLQFEAGAIVGAMVGRHCLFAFGDDSSDEALLALVDEVRVILADHDLGAIPDESAAVAEPEEVVEDVALPVAPSAPPPVGARYRGSSGAKPSTKPAYPRRRPFGR